MYSLMLPVLLICVLLLCKVDNVDLKSLNTGFTDMDPVDQTTPNCNIFRITSDNYVDFDGKCRNSYHIRQCCKDLLVFASNHRVRPSIRIRLTASQSIFHCLHLFQQRRLFMLSFEQQSSSSLHDRNTYIQNRYICPNVVSVNKRRQFPSLPRLISPTVSPGLNSLQQLPPFPTPHSPQLPSNPNLQRQGPPLPRQIVPTVSTVANLPRQLPPLQRPVSPKFPPNSNLQRQGQPPLQRQTISPTAPTVPNLPRQLPPLRRPLAPEARPIPNSHPEVPLLPRLTSTKVPDIPNIPRPFPPPPRSAVSGTFPPIPDLPMPDWDKLNPFLKYPTKSTSEGEATSKTTTALPTWTEISFNSTFYETDFPTNDDVTAVSTPSPSSRSSAIISSIPGTTVSPDSTANPTSFTPIQSSSAIHRRQSKQHRTTT